MKIETGIKEILSVKTFPIKTLVSFLLSLSFDISLVINKEEPNSIKSEINIPKVWNTPIVPNSTAPTVLAINGNKKIDSI